MLQENKGQIQQRILPVWFVGTQHGAELTAWSRDCFPSIPISFLCCRGKDANCAFESHQERESSETEIRGTSSCWSNFCISVFLWGQWDVWQWNQIQALQTAPSIPSVLLTALGNPSNITIWR